MLTIDIFSKANRAIASICIFSLFISCEKEIEMNIKDSPSVLVINSLVQDGSPWDIELTASHFILDNKPIQTISDAQLTLIDGNGDSIEIHQQDSRYYTDSGVVAHAGETYTITAQHPDYPTATAKCTVPVPVRIESVTIGEKTVENDQTYYRLQIRFTDPQGRNFYRLRVLQQRTYPVYKYTGDPYEPEMMVIDTLAYGDSTETNIYPTGYYFGQSSPYKDNSAGCFTDQLFDGKATTLEILMDTYSIENTQMDEAYLIIELESMSEDYYWYVISKDAYSASNGNPFAQPVQVNSNVSGGLGIFGAHGVSAPVTVSLPKTNVYPDYYY